MRKILEKHIVGSDFTYASTCTGDNLDEKVIAVRGNQWDTVQFEKLDDGFRLTFYGNMEEAQLFEFMQVVLQEIPKALPQTTLSTQ